MLLEEKVKISVISEFLILPYTQNRKLENLGKFSLTSNFDSCCNLRCKNDKKLTRTKPWFCRGFPVSRRIQKRQK